MFKQNLYFLKNINSKLFFKLNIFFSNKTEYFLSQISKIINIHIKKPIISNKKIYIKLIENKNLFLFFYKFFFKTTLYLFFSEFYYLITLNF